MLQAWVRSPESAEPSLRGSALRLQFCQARAVGLSCGLDELWMSRNHTFVATRIFPNMLTCSQKVCFFADIFFRVCWNILVYVPDMPSRPPPSSDGLHTHSYGNLNIFVLRGVATTIWLGVPPLVIVWTWKMYFSMGDSESTCVYYLEDFFKL